MMSIDSDLYLFLKRNEGAIIQEWTKAQTSGGTLRRELMREMELREQCREFFTRFTDLCQEGRLQHFDGPEWERARTFLNELSRSRAQHGFTPSETASFVFSLKRAIFAQLPLDASLSLEAQSEMLRMTSEALDVLGLYTTEVYQKGREEIIARQQQEMLELSTPVVKLWEGILALPMIGTLDSSRTQVVMESLLQRIVETGSRIAIIDITGVPMVDTLVAQHLMKTVAAARLMGADCIISGIRPQIAQTIVHLAVDLGSITTKATLADAFMLALQRLGMSMSRLPALAKA